MFDRVTRLTGLYALIAAAAAVLLAPLLALSYFATADGAEALETGTVSAWADPARDLIGGLVTWAERSRCSFPRFSSALVRSARGVLPRRAGSSAGGGGSPSSATAWRASA